MALPPSYYRRSKPRVQNAENLIRLIEQRMNILRSALGGSGSSKLSQFEASRIQTDVLVAMTELFSAPVNYAGYFLDPTQISSDATYVD